MDAISFYLQATGIQRVLLLGAPNPPPPGVSPGQVFLARGSVYGTKDAGRSAWLWLRDILLSLGFIESFFEKCLFLLADGDKLVGMLMTYVDDFLHGGDRHSEKWINIIEELKKRVDMLVAGDTFPFLGRTDRRWHDSHLTARVLP